MKIGVAAKLHRTDFVPTLEEILRWLEERGGEVVLEEEVASELSLEGFATAPRAALPAQVDAMVVFGGDGTLLSVARAIQGAHAPILGVNLGSLGFLTEVTLQEVYPALERLLAGDYRISRRSMLRVEVSREKTRWTFDALNDMVINKGALARIVSMSAFINEEFIADFHADGMIVSTPTGSTAYSLSAGGPILYTDLDAVLLTPICPHTLTHRPLVIPFENSIRIRVHSGEDVMMTVDGQVGMELEEGDEVHCTRSPRKIELVQPSQRGFFDILRKKLKWGER